MVCLSISSFTSGAGKLFENVLGGLEPRDMGVVENREAIGFEFDDLIQRLRKGSDRLVR